ncbi:tetratricopeptide repeat protein, partial [Candidatus Gracilibacteria bacterium]|nr:tetratricopeptide repeat protein [Candidatus Gracilibacteria bacterium]
MSDHPESAQEDIEEVQRYDELLRSLASDAVVYDIPRAAEICYLLGWYLTNNSEHDTAFIWLEQAVELAERRYGSMHPITAEAWCRLGLCCIFRSEFELSEQALRRMQAIQAVIYPEQHPERLIGYQNMAQLLVIAGDYAASEAMIRRALRGQIARFHSGDELQRSNASLRIARGLRILGQNAAETGRLWRAYRLFALADTRQVPVTKTRAQIRFDRGYLALVLGRYTEARRCLEEVAALRQELHKNRRDEQGRIWHHDSAETHKFFGLLALHIGNLDEAARHTDEALTIYQTTLGNASLEVGETYEQLATIAMHRGKLTEAAQLLTDAAAIFARLDKGRPTPRTTRTLLRKAQLAVLRGDCAEAKSLCLTVEEWGQTQKHNRHPLVLWAGALRAEIARRNRDLTTAKQQWALVFPELRRVFRKHPVLQRLSTQSPIPVLNPLDILVGESRMAPLSCAESHAIVADIVSSIALCRLPFRLGGRHRAYSRLRRAATARAGHGPGRVRRRAGPHSARR